MFQESFRYDSGLGDNAIYAILLYNNGYWDFVNKTKSETLTVDCKVFLNEVSGTSDTDSWYVGEFNVPDGGPWPIELFIGAAKVGDNIAYGMSLGSSVFEPVSVADVERQLRTDLSLETLEIELFITAVRKRAETITKRALVETTEFLVLGTFPIILELRKPPLNEVTSIKYIDLEGVEQTLSPLAYRVIKDKSEPEMLSYIIPAYGINWPTHRQDRAVITVEYTCGYTPATCPEPIKQWMLINIGSLYENRESVVTSKNNILDLSKTLADPLLDGYRIARL